MTQALAQANWTTYIKRIFLLDKSRYLHIVVSIICAKDSSAWRSIPRLYWSCFPLFSIKCKTPQPPCCHGSQLRHAVKKWNSGSQFGLKQEQQGLICVGAGMGELQQMAQPCVCAAGPRLREWINQQPACSCIKLLYLYFSIRNDLMQLGTLQ